MSQEVERGKETSQGGLMMGLADYIMEEELYPKSAGTLLQDFSLETVVITLPIFLTAVITIMAALMGPVPTLYQALC